MSRGLPDSSLGEVVAAAARRKSTLLAQSKERRLDGTGWPWRVRLYGPAPGETGYQIIFKAPAGDHRRGTPTIHPRAAPRFQARPRPTEGGVSAVDDPRYVFLSAGEVLACYGWGKTKGYQNLKDRTLVPPVMTHPDRWRRRRWRFCSRPSGRS